MSKVLAIVGRPNVGKSTFFNRMLQRREAIIDDTPGVTRDRHYGQSDWNGVTFTLVDTGGYVVGSDDSFEREIRRQVDFALQESDAVLFLVDNKDGLTDMDREVAQLLRRTERPVYLVVNKVDDPTHVNDAMEFYALGFEEYFTISAANGSGTGDLLDRVVSDLPQDHEEPKEDAMPRFAIVGRPNAGKSTLTNVLMGEERNIVTDIAGTTRDSIESVYNKFGHTFKLVDTAGIRKKGKVSDNLEFYSVMRAIRTIENCDVCALIIDAERGFEAQDMNIFQLAIRNRKGILIVVNKWDLIEKDHETMKQYEKQIRNKIAPFTDVPILFISALEKQRVHKLIQLLMDVSENRKTRIKTSKLNEVMLPIIQRQPPPAIKGKYIKIKYCTQLPTRSPQFAFFANLPQYVKEPYKRFIENQLRKQFNFTGVPIEVYFRRK